MQNVTHPARSIPWWGAGLFRGRWNPSLLDTLLPSLTLWQKLAIAVLFIGLLVALGRVRFYLPDNPVPITLQTFGVLLTGGILGWRWGLFAIAGWYLLGMAGLPVFKDGGNGWAYVSAGVTGGYLIGFIVAGWVVGVLAQRGWTHSRSLWPMLLGNLLIYLPGLLWLHFNDFGWPAEGELFKSGMYPFIPGDLVKLMAASIVTGALWNVASRRAGE